MEKKIFTKILSIMIVIFLGIMILPNISAYAKVKLSDKKITLRVDRKAYLTITGTNKAVTWSSSNPRVATVDSDGSVKGISRGKATIYAKISPKTILKCKVKVISFNEEEVRKKIKLEPIIFKEGGIIKVKNKSKFDVKVYVTYKGFDSSGVKVVSSRDLIYLVAGETNYFSPISTKKITDLKCDIETVEEFFLVSQPELTATYEKKEWKRVNYIVNNVKSTTAQYLHATALFMKKGKIIGAAEAGIMGRLDGNEKTRITAWIPDYASNYDEIKIVFAYFYGSLSFR